MRVNDVGALDEGAPARVRLQAGAAVPDGAPNILGVHDHGVLVVGKIHVRDLAVAQIAMLEWTVCVVHRFLDHLSSFRALRRWCAARASVVCRIERR
jgi:hypothetical protein